MTRKSRLNKESENFLEQNDDAKLIRLLCYSRNSGHIFFAFSAEIQENLNIRLRDSL